MLSDRLQVLFFSLKVPDTVDASLKKAANWCKFISGSTSPEVLRELGNSADWKEEYGMAMDAYMKVSAEEKAWAYHLSMDRAEADYWNGLELAEEKGRREQALSAARNFLALHVTSNEQIAKAVGLPLEEVEKLAAQLDATPVEA